MSGVDILAAHAATRPDKPALVAGGRTVSFAELNRRVNQAARALRSLGISRGDRVAGMAYNSIEGVEVTHACRKVQAVGVPVNYRLRGGEVAYLLNDSGASVVFAGPEFVSVIDSARDQVRGERTYVSYGREAPQGWLSYEEVLDGHDGADVEMPEDSALGASMIYTSGTTGAPKGAHRPNGIGLDYVLQVVSLFEISGSDVHLLCGPGYHSAVGFFALLHLMLGGTLVIQPKFDASQALALIDRHRVTTTFMAPTLLQRLVDLPEPERRAADTSSLRAIILGAAPCPISLKERAIGWLGDVIWEFYGSTETGVNTLLRPEEQLRKPGSCGRAAPGQEIRLLDAGGHEVPDGTPGELWVRNASLAEYFNRPEATQKSMRDGFFSVGDIAYRDADGYYYICDRAVDMVISGGVNIYPAEVEAVLHAHPAVRDAAVIGVPDAQWGEAVKALVALRPGASAGEAELIAWCAERVAGYKKPRSIDFVEELPRDAAGKLLKRRIREPYWEGAARRV